MMKLHLTVFGCCLVLTSNCLGDLEIDFTQEGANDTRITISGAGTVTGTGSNPGQILEFFNFTGTPFSGGFSDLDFNLVTDLTIFGLDASDSNSPYTSNFGIITLNNGGAGGSDFDLRGDFSIGLGDTYNASGSSVVTGLAFSDLISGSYTATGAEAGKFGTVTMNISVPEPSAAAFALIAIAGTVFLGIRRFKSEANG